MTAIISVFSQWATTRVALAVKDRPVRCLVGSDLSAPLTEFVLEGGHRIQVRCHRRCYRIREPQFRYRSPPWPVPNELDEVTNVLTVSQLGVRVAESIEVLLQGLQLGRMLGRGCHGLSSIRRK